MISHHINNAHCIVWEVLPQVSAQLEVSSFSNSSSDLIVMCRPLLSMKMSVSQLAIINFFLHWGQISSNMSTGERRVFGAEVIIRRTPFACSLCLECFCKSWVTSSPSLNLWRSTHGSVPTDSHFHKQMSDNLMTSSPRLPPCTHGSSVCLLALLLFQLLVSIYFVYLWFNFSGVYIVTWMICVSVHTCSSNLTPHHTLLAGRSRRVWA